MTAAKIVIYCKDQESEQLLIDTVSSHYKCVVTVQSSGDLAKRLMADSIKIVMVSTESFKNSLAVYYHALSFIPDNKLPEHAFVPLVARHDEKQAWEAFNAGIADDYIVSRPLYEPHRPVMVCDHLFKEMGFAKQTSDSEELLAQIAKMPERIRDIITHGIVRKDNLKKEFESTVQSIDKALDHAAEQIQAHQKIALDMEQLQHTLSSICSNEIRPELLKLQNKAISLLEHVIEDLDDAATTNKSASPDLPKRPFNNLYKSESTLSVKTKTPTIPNVLVVDDDAISLSVTRKSLQTFLLNVDTTNSGRRALASLSTKDYDLLLIDINLSDCNGMFVINQLANNEGKNQHIPKVILSSKRDKQSIKTASEMGASDYLLKPIHKEILKKLCQKYDISLMKKK